MVPCIFTNRKGYVEIPSQAFSCGLFPLFMIDSPFQRLFTDTNMYNADLKEEMEDFYSHLEKLMLDEKVTMPSKKNYDLVLDVMRTENQTVQWSYYFACHKTRCLFWLDEYDASSEIYGVESPAHASVSPSFTNLPLSINSCAEHRLEDLFWYITSLLVKLNWFS